MNIGLVTLTAVGGWVMLTGISAFYWGSRPYLRLLPIIYGLCFGFIYRVLHRFHCEFSFTPAEFCFLN